MIDKITESLNTVSGKFAALVGGTPISNLAILVVLGVIAYLLFIANKDNTNNIKWTDMLVQQNVAGTGTLSLTKVLQLVGGVTSTWVIVVSTLDQKLSSEIFLTYLTYVGAIEGWSKFVAAKYGVPDSTNTPDPAKTHD